MSGFSRTSGFARQQQLRLALRLEPDPGHDLGVRERGGDGVVDRPEREPGSDRLAHVDLRPGRPVGIVTRPERQLRLDALGGEEGVVDDLDVEVGVARARGGLDEVEHGDRRHGAGGVEDAGQR